MIWKPIEVDPVTCPSCLQPFIRIAELQAPIRRIYIHRQSNGTSHNPIDFCVDPSSRTIQQTQLDLAIQGCNQINVKNVEKGVDKRIKEMAKSRVVGMKQDTKQAERGTQIEVSKDSKIVGFSHSERGAKEMAFVGFDLVKLREEFPSQGVGRAGKPSVAISDKGRLTFSTEVTKVFDGCSVVIPSRDKDNSLRIRFDGFAKPPAGKEKQVMELSRSKPGKNGKAAAKNAALQAVQILKSLQYDYIKAGNQTYDVEKMDNEKHIVVFSLPASLPSPKPKKDRKKRAAKKGQVQTQGQLGQQGQSNGAAANGAPSPASESMGGNRALPPSVEDELLIDE